MQYTIPGQRAVVLAFLFTLVSAATLLIAPIQVPREVPADDPRVEEGDEVDDDGTVTIYEDGKLLEEETAPVAAMVLLAPIAITGAAVWFTKRPQRSTAWSIAMVALAGYVFFVGSYAIISLPSLVALAVAGFQSRRADNKVRVAELKAQRAARKAAKGGTVIDVDSTEVEAADEADDELVDELDDERVDDDSDSRS
jgi:heme exporter protein D